MRGWVGVSAALLPASAGFPRPGSGRRCPLVLGHRAAALWEAQRGQWWSRVAGGRSNRSGCFSNPNPAVDRLLVKWSLASSAPNRVEVSMMRKFCDTGVRKRLADTGVGRVERFKRTVSPPSPFILLPRNCLVWKE